MKGFRKASTVTFLLAKCSIFNAPSVGFEKVRRATS
jgi:hypothetical protein